VKSVCLSQPLPWRVALPFHTQGLKFDLVVHSPYRALAGLFQV
jgi:hypothetical protein